MRIALLANDTRGGIQPYLAVGLRLRSAGHEVRFVAPADFTSMAEAAGLPFAPLTGGVEAAMKGSGGAATKGSIASTRFARRELPKILKVWLQESLEACQGTEVIAGGIGGMVLGLPVSEKLGVPFVEMHLQPVGAPTTAYPGVLLSGTPRWLGGWAWRLSHHLTEAALWMPFRGATARARRDVLGLAGPPKLRGDGAVLYGFSRHVVPVPQDGDRERIVTGYWTLPARGDYRPPEALEAFLARGGPVVSIGFGSMATENPEALTAMVLAAARRAGVRAVLVAGWGGLGAAADGADSIQVDSVPYDWLFPRVQAAVHHGGAGTTGAALTAGVPSVVTPFTMDQPFWASRVVALGAGPKPIPLRQLTQARLAAALRGTIDDQAMRARAQALGAQLRAEDGLGAVVEHFQRLASPPRAGSG